MALGNGSLLAGNFIFCGSLNAHRLRVPFEGEVDLKKRVAFGRDGRPLSRGAAGPFRRVVPRPAAQRAAGNEHAEPACTAR